MTDCGSDESEGHAPRFVPLIAEKTWGGICSLYSELVGKRAATPKCLPFLPVGEQGYGDPDALRVLFCGIAAGVVDQGEGGLLDYECRAKAIGSHFGLDTRRRAKKGHGAFWREIAEVSELLASREGYPRRQIKLGWANILPINNNETGSTSPSSDLIDRQKELSKAVWQDLFRGGRSDLNQRTVIVATFGEKNFDLDDLSPRISWEHSDGPLWSKRCEKHLPGVVWVKHIRYRASRSQTEPQAACIARAVEDCLATR